MKPSQVKRALKIAIKAKLPCFLWGSPGIGKSQIVAQIAAELDLKLIDVRAVQFDPVDLRGIPRIEGDYCSWTIPAFLPREGKGILFLDELNAAPPLVQAACYQLVLDRRLGDYTLPDGWIIIAAGNKDSDRAITTRMSSALASRFMHILEFNVDLEDWIAWAFQNEISPEIISFLRYRPDLLHNFDPGRNDKAYPCPRTWEYTSKVLAWAPDADIEHELISGIVGAGAATEFIGFLRIYRDLPPIEPILKDPQKAKVPTNAAVLYALCGALARKVNEKNIDNAIAYAQKIRTEHNGEYAEFSVLLVKDIIRKSPDLMNTPAFNKWGIENQDILL